MQGLMFNDDETNFFYRVPAEEVSAEAIDEHVDDILRSGVSCFLCNTNGMRTNYDSEGCEPAWIGYDPDGPDDQEALKGCPPDVVRAERPVLDSMIALHRQGVDYPARVIARCRTRGVSPWISLRMNDAHDTLETNSPSQSTFWKDNPHLRRVPYSFSARPDQALDYAHPEVRDHYKRLIGETLERYDVDGLELDFMRHQFHFGVGRELAGAKLLTAWLKEIRDMVSRAGASQGHPVRLGLRVPSRPNTARRIGLDVVEWARQGLLNLLIVTPSGYATTTEFDMPIHLWKDLLSPYGVKLAGCLEPGIHRYAGAAHEFVTPETAAGAAMAILSGGADAVYLFNYFFKFTRFTERGGWTREDFDNTLRAMNSLEALEALPRRHVVTYREVLAPGELVGANPMVLATRLGGRHVWSELRPVEYPLPAVGLHLAFRLQTGPRPTSREVEVVIGLEADTDASVYEPSVRVNGVECKAAVQQPDKGGLFTYSVPPEALADEEHVIKVSGNTFTGKFLKVTRVEFAVGA